MRWCCALVLAISAVARPVAADDAGARAPVDAGTELGEVDTAGDDVEVVTAGDDVEVATAGDDVEVATAGDDVEVAKARDGGEIATAGDDVEVAKAGDGVEIAAADEVDPWQPADLPPSEQPGNVSTTRRALAIGAAIVPGAVLRGFGSWVAGEKPAAKQLAIAGGGGFLLAALAGGVIAGSGASRETVPLVPLVVTGGGILLTSWAEDIFVAAGGSRLGGKPRALAPWSVEVGTTWLRDAYRDRALLRAGGRVELGRVSLGGLTLVDAGGDTQLGEADARVRILGAPATGEVVANGSRLLARAGTRYHRDDEDMLTQTFGELELIGRLDLASVDDVFGSSFVEGSMGLGRVHVSYADDASEWDTILLHRFAWGLYLGTRSEASWFYDHRRDHLAGGLAALRAAGFIGSLGANIDLRVRGPWAMRAELEVGNGWVTTLALGYRGGPR